MDRITPAYAVYQQNETISIWKQAINLFEKVQGSLGVMT